MAKILLVEDDPMIADIYQKKFEAENFEVKNAKTGQEALKFAAQENFDLILLDMVIPELNGIEVLKELKQSGKYPQNLHVVVFSNLNQTDTQREALEIGADGFIGKTEYSPSELVREVDRMIKQFSEKDKNGLKKVEKNVNIPKVENVSNDKKRVLIIEDEEIFLEMFGKKLINDGFEVEYAQNGAWGIRKAIEENFDLIITDMMMPAMTGYDIIEKLKEDEKAKNIPIIAISASLPDEETHLVKNLGVEHFFVKTQIVPSDLSRTVQEILRKDKK